MARELQELREEIRELVPRGVYLEAPVPFELLPEHLRMSLCLSGQPTPAAGVQAVFLSEGGEGSFGIWTKAWPEFDRVATYYEIERGLVELSFQTRLARLPLSLLEVTVGTPTREAPRPIEGRYFICARPQELQAA